VRNLGSSIKLKPVEQIEDMEMTTHKPIYAIVLASILTAALSGCADFRPGETGTRTADANITADIEARLNQLPALGPPGSIAVQTRDHVVYLNGAVDVGLEKRIAEATAKQSPGVTSVVNNIAVSHS
jgi:osmotically-inducible protein OsmY